MNIKIREGRIEDLNEGLLDVFIEGYRFHQNGRPDIFADISDEMLKQDLIKNMETLSILVILDNENVVGYIAYEIREKHSKKINIDQLVITEKYRKDGLGKKLMDAVKNIGIEEKCDRIELDCWMFNTNALAMYEHIGFDRQRIIYEMKL